MKTSVDFLRELSEVQQILREGEQNEEIYYRAIEAGEEGDSNSLSVLDEFLRSIELEISPQNRLAAASRLLSLREDSLVQVLKKSGRSQDGIDRAIAISYRWVRDHYHAIHEEFLHKIEKQGLLTHFYRAVLRGSHRVGLAFSDWHPQWIETILQGVNRSILQEHNDNKEEVHHFIEKNRLLDKGHDGNLGDRCYSILKKIEDQWSSHSYRDGFPAAVEKVLIELGTWKEELTKLEDKVFHEKDAWLNYIQSLRNALEERDVDLLIERWSKVDLVWMKITGPIQPCHPLEYYEDHFRQCVALEWDLRIANPEHSTRGRRRERVQDMAANIFQSLDISHEKYSEVISYSDKKLDLTQLHIGRSAMYYGALFTGLPSAQVVPNDEVISKEYGKKIFAFPDHVLQNQRSRPFLRLASEVFEQEYLRENRTLLFQNRLLWFQLYDISTIGHEYGHILWVDDDTEARMNLGGNYKNVEEWKATTGGLLAFFLGDEERSGGPELRNHILKDVIGRGVGLMAWREAPEVEAYYCEGLIHLAGLFETKVLSFDESAKKLLVDTSEEAYSRIREWYQQAYKHLVKDFYLPKNDPTGFLKEYTITEGNYFMPSQPEIYSMVSWYWDLYQKYGREIDTSDHRDNYRPFDETGV
ncbi:invasion protein CiaB [bacterium]|jgi:hypothetical protein|nr:invasion protein CiaB [bacterium]